MHLMVDICKILRGGSKHLQVAVTSVFGVGGTASTHVSMSADVTLLIQMAQGFDDGVHRIVE